MKKDQYNVVLMTILTIVGYFVGSTIYVLVFKDNIILQTLTGSFTALLAALGHFGYVYKKRPELINAMFVEQNDEREKTIREKAGHLTLLFLFIILFLMTFFSLINSKIDLLLLTSGLYILSLIVYLSLTYYLKKVL